MKDINLKSSSDESSAPSIIQFKIFGYGVVAFFFVFGGFWAYFTPLASATMAQGRVMSESSNKKIQHIDGGTVYKIFVENGMSVEKGHPLIAMDTTRLEADYQFYENQYLRLLAKEARLISERELKSKVTFSKGLLEHKAQSLSQSIQQSEVDIFNANREHIRDFMINTKEQMGHIKDSITQSKLQMKHDVRQIELVHKEVVALKKLVSNKQIEATKLWGKQRELEALSNEEIEKKQAVTRGLNQLSDLRRQIESNLNERHLQTVNELSGVQNELSKIQQQITVSKDKLVQSIILAPHSGIVVNLNIHSRGEVIRSGDTLLEIVPNQDELIIDAKVNPNDIDSIEIGQNTFIKLSAYNQRYSSELTGTLQYISADSLLDEQTRQEYYQAKIHINPKDLSAETKVQLYPGMLAEVMIIKKKRTLWNYFTVPIYKSINKAFRE